MKTLKFLYFFKVALLPGLAVIGYFVQQGGVDWTEIIEDPNAEELNGPFFWGILSLITMAFVSLLYFRKLEEIKSPKGLIALFFAIFQTPLILVIMYYYFNVKLNFWTGSMSALLIDMNAMALATLFLHFKGNSETDEFEAVKFYFIVPPLLLNISVYGWYIWSDLLQQGFFQQLPFYVAIIADTYFYIKALSDNKSAERQAEKVLGKEFISGVVLVPTWGMLLLVHPLWPLIKGFF